MMWWDRLLGTYRSPDAIRAFNKSTETEVLGGSNYVVAGDAPAEVADEIDVRKKE